MVESPKMLTLFYPLQLNYNTEFFEFTDYLCRKCELLGI